MIALLRSRAFVLALVVVVSALCAYQLATIAGHKPSVTASSAGILWPNGKALEPFELTDHHGRRFDLERLRGRWTLLSFGYTSCPDICPMTASTVHQTLVKLAELDESTDDIQAVFVSVDPQRDTPQRLGAWVEYFDERYVGVTAQPQALEALTRQLGVSYETGTPDEHGFYLVSHTASVMLIDPSAHLVAILGLPHDANEMARILTEIRTKSTGYAASATRREPRLLLATNFRN